MKFRAAFCLAISLATSAGRAFADDPPVVAETPPAAPAVATPAAAAAPPEQDGVAIVAAGTPVIVSGFVQADWVAWNQASQDQLSSNGQPLNETRFLLRRGHLRAAVEREWVLGSLEIDANTVNGPIVRPIDAEASFRWRRDKEEGSPFVMATMGLFKTPFGFEVLEADNRRPFLERSTMIRAFFPGEYDLGLRLAGGWRAFNYALGLMNGDPIGERAFPGRDPNKSKDLVFHVGVDTDISSRVRVQGGFSGVTGSGFHPGTPSTKDVIVWRDTNENGLVESTEVQAIAGSAASASQTFHHFAIGGDLRLLVEVPRLGTLTLRGEIVRASNLDRGITPADPVSAGRDLREFGWTAGATQEITRWGMIGVRYDYYDPDGDALNQQAAAQVPKNASFSTLAVLGVVRFQKERLILEYDHNTNPLGRSVTGLPTTLKDDTFTVRGEVSF